MKNYLTELEIDKIENFCKDEVLFNAVKKVILQGLYTHGTVQKGLNINPLQNGAFALASVAMNNPIPDEMLGQHIRSMWSGLNALENAYADLKSIKNEQELIESPLNNAI